MLSLAVKHRLNVGLLHFQHSLRRCLSWFTLTDDFNELASLNTLAKLGRNRFVGRESNVAPQRIGHDFAHVGYRLAFGGIVTSKRDGLLRPFRDLILRETQAAALDSFAH